MKLLVVTYLGFFSLLAQTLLFRDFLTAFDGNELAIGLFFFSWLLWICVGATFARRESWIPDKIANRYETLLLLYAPAFLLQRHLLLNARELVGVAAYELFPLGKIIPSLIIANAPVSFATGALFVLACRWLKEDDSPASKVYIFESLGSFAGAVTVTLALYFGFPGEAIILSAFIGLLVVAGGYSAWTAKGHFSKLAAFSAIGVVALTLALNLGLARAWRHHENRKDWLRLIPKGRYLKSFTTPQATYHLGEYEGDVIVTAWNSVVANYPDRERSAEVAAMTLAQKPNTRRVLVIGEGGLSLCRRLATVKSVERLVWLNSDVDYSTTLSTALPEKIFLNRQRIDIPGVNVHQFLKTADERFDAVVLEVSDLSTLAMNRFFTEDFFASLKHRMTNDGVVAVQVPAGENFMGPELTFLGASLYHTLTSVFDHFVLKPGEASWFFACDQAETLTDDPDLLVRRLRGNRDATAIYPPENLYSLFPAERIAFQMGEYREAIRRAGERMLLNTNERPKAFFYSLLFTIKQLGWVRATIPTLRKIMTRLFPCAALLIVFYGMARLAFGRRNQRLLGGLFRLGSVTATFDALFLIFATAVAGMVVNLTLMFAYQLRFGSIFLSFGIISALFMIGLFLGGLATNRLLRLFKGNDAWTPAAPLVLLLFLTILIVVPPPSTRWTFAVLFTLAGACTGMAYPLAASKLRKRGQSPSVAGANLELCDHLGGAMAGLSSSLVLLPVFGARKSLILMGILILVALSHVWLLSGERTDHPAQRASNRWIVVLGYLMFGFVAYAWCAKMVWTMASTPPIPSAAVPETVRDWEGDASRIIAKRVEIHKKPVTYHEFLDPSGDTQGYAFKSSDFSSRSISGFGGPMRAWLHVDPSGNLLNFKMIECNETSEYLRKVLEAKDRFVGTSIFDGAAPEERVTVTGATITSNALSLLLDEAGSGFATAVSNRRGPAQPSAETIKRWLKPSVIVVAICILAAIVVRFNVTRRVRIAFLATVFLVLGVWLNAQYSMEHVYNLLSRNLPTPGIAFLLIVVIPGIVLLFGNVHCGYLCPFGALQELIHELKPKRWRTEPSPALVKLGQDVKYLVLWLLLMALVFGVDRSILEGDALRSVFASIHHSTPFIAMVVLALLWSLPFNRFWCRNLCPTGAFLALLNGLRPLKRWLPKIITGRCDLGVTTVRQLDCLNCDRCRFGGDAPSMNGSDPTANLRNVVFLVGIAAALGLAGFIAIKATRREPRSAATAPPSPKGAPRIKTKPLALPPSDDSAPSEEDTDESRFHPRKQPRVYDVDMDKIKRLIRQNRLSDQPARFSRELRGDRSEDR